MSAEPSLFDGELVATPITGWRVWSVQKLTRLTLDHDVLAEMSERFEQGENPFALDHLLGMRLGSTGVEGTWSAGAGKATCQGEQRHEAPSRDCGCGFWALRSELDLFARFGFGALTPPFAFGQVEMWGRIIEQAQGWRAEYARPVSIALVGGSEDQRRELAAYYGVEVTEAERLPGEPETLPDPMGMTYQQLLAQARPNWSPQHAPPLITGGFSSYPKLKTVSVSAFPEPPKRHNLLATLIRWVNLAVAVACSAAALVFFIRWLNEVPQ